METDFLVIGSGIAGLSFAVKAATLGKVTVVTKKDKLDSATNLAQGGIAAVLDDDDTFESHIADTLESGAGLCDEHIVRLVVEDGPQRINELIAIGVNFVKAATGNLSLGKEGGHTHRRVAHAMDLTGREIERALVSKVSEFSTVEILENHMCVDLITREKNGVNTCCGAFVMRDGEDIFPIRAKVVVLCTGGIGKVYLYTSNPDIATGDGIAVAYRAGAEIGNMEFVQFHPTCLFHHQAKNFLISEAVRGEGALLKNEKGYRFLKDYEPEKMELATRDKVARAIDTEMKRSGADCVYLDITHKSREFLQKRFPTIFNKCFSLGIDISKQPIPVVPAAHYMCGGITVDRFGKSSLKGLYALGETACTGLHGGNRLASNSLLEAVVFAHSAYQDCKKHWLSISKEKHVVEHSTLKNSEKSIDEEILINHNWDILRRIMWNYVGIVRKKKRLEKAEQQIADLRSEINEILKSNKLSPNMLELRNIMLVASLIVGAAIKRKHSAGLHYILDTEKMK